MPGIARRTIRPVAYPSRRACAAPRDEGRAYRLPVQAFALLPSTVICSFAPRMPSPSGGGLGLTYVTGALVKVGQLLAAAMTGGERWGWLPNLLLWAALVAGALAYASF